MKPHNPLESVVIIVKESHTSDNYFAALAELMALTWQLNHHLILNHRPRAWLQPD